MAPRRPGNDSTEFYAEYDRPEVYTVTKTRRPIVTVVWDYYSPRVKFFTKVVDVIKEGGRLVPSGAMGIATTRDAKITLTAEYATMTSLANGFDDLFRNVPSSPVHK